MKQMLIYIALIFSLPTSATALTSSQTQFIIWGETCCYSREVIDSVQQPVYVYSPVINLNLPPLKEPPSKLSWTLFYTLQVLDVYTTEKALHYSCVKEVNPILGKSPDVKDMIGLKVLLFVPAIWYANKYEPWSNEDLAGANYLMTAVVANNFDVWNNAKTNKNCIKIR